MAVAAMKDVYFTCQDTVLHCSWMLPLRLQGVMTHTAVRPAQRVEIHGANKCLISLGNDMSGEER